MKLRPLSARYDPDEHKQYLDGLLDVVDGDDASVRNVALTGRYGAGKSSVLVQLKKVRDDRVLFLSLSTMGRARNAVAEAEDRAEESTPGPEAADPAAKAAQTNDIEKELVKQLLHREPARKLPLSRYHRISSPGKIRAAGAAAAQVAVIAAVLWMLDAIPDIRGLTADEDGWNGWKRVAAGVFAFGLATAALTWLRLVIYDKAISAISAGGASISLSEKNKTESYFDRYLDEIVYYFRRFKKIDIVVFEDLDRFDNPQIFEELRELNELLNNSKEMGRTIRFVYALKDSIFEKLGHDETTASLADDAKAEVERANRTKFFDLVIPMVPFITPRTSRSLLKTLLTTEPAPLPVDADVRDLVAKHITDMRLLTNIRNEYAVFSQRLITEGKGVPAMRQESLFALMVYKNIQLSDYENLLLGRSALDTLYTEFVSIVTETMRAKQTRLREIENSLALTQAFAQRASTYGERLTLTLDAIRTHLPNGPASALSTLSVGGKDFTADDIGTDDFWRELVSSQTNLVAHYVLQYNAAPKINLSFKQVCDLLREDLSIGVWDEQGRHDVHAERSEIEADLEVLHRADFKEIAAHQNFTRTEDGVAENFETILRRTVKSEVCRDLVWHGFIDQNFAAYVSQFYGDLVTMRAMTFVVQHVQRNNPYFDYPFADATSAADGPTAGPDGKFPGDRDIESVFAEVGDDFLDQASGYNTAILDYLLRNSDPRAMRILGRVLRLADEPDLAFLDSYLTNGKQALELVGIVASKWPETFTHLTTSTTLGDDRRRQLVNEALLRASDQVAYDLGDQVREYLRTQYAELSLFVNPTEPPAADKTVALLARASFKCDDLAKVSPQMRVRLVVADQYVLSARNLRTALGEAPADAQVDASQPSAIQKPLGLDRIRDENEDVYRDCLAAPDTYLDIIDADDATTALLTDRAAFLEILNDLATWETDDIVVGLRLTPDDWTVDLLDDAIVSAQTWPALARTHRFPLTFANFKAYVEWGQGIEHNLGTHLADAKIFVGPGPTTATASDTGTDPAADDAADGAGDLVVKDAASAAVLILNADVEVGAAAVRVKLAASLHPALLAVDAIEPERGELLGLLIAARLVDDAVETFERFVPMDSATLTFAAERSKHLGTFITTQWISEDLVAVLNSNTVPAATHEAILGRFDELIPDERNSLLAAARRAAKQRVPLTATTIHRVANQTHDVTVVSQLITQAGDGISQPDIVGALAATGGDLVKLSNPGEKFPVDSNRDLLVVLRKLADDGYLTLNTKKGAVVEVN